MHRLLQITLEPSATDELCGKIRDNENVVGLSVSRGESLKPPGDVVTVYVLNRSADDVLRAVGEVTGGENFTVTTSQVTSLIDPLHDDKITSDFDEAIWEEIETGLRHQGRVSPNFLALMSLGGAIAAIGLTLDGAAQVTAFTAAAIIAPGFEPLAKIPLGIVLGSWGIVKRGFYSSAVGYAILILTAAATMFLLLQTNTVTVSEMTGNEAVQSLAEPGLRDFLISIFSAAAGIIMLAAYRKSVIAGPLIGLVMIQAVALVGASLAAGQYDLCLAALRRFGYDVMFTAVFGLLIFYLKQVLTHKRKPLV